MGEKEGEESFPEINDTTIADTAAVAPEEETSSSSEGEEFYDVNEEPAPGEMDRPVMGMRGKKRVKSVRRGRKPANVCKKGAKKGAKKGKKGCK